ncbi:MAG TPA: aminotransferase class I/II-fold pyridoxal phosphate-dependent enzyme [Candidatus Deferrimicrobium sp.]|nr:aminotransferase class I/II-fold pyridoxal phosphate-dependent enzyme [Candidatus Deferrimicrobium sp.]
MNPLAEELNAIIKKGNSYIYDMLSELGKKLYFPKGILSQSAEASKSAHKYNATIGIATEGAEPMYLPSAYKFFNGLTPKELFVYAPAAGIPRLREKWKEKQIYDNPLLKDKNFSTPIVTNALTHGLSIIADLFANPNDTLILPDKLWGNYKLIFEVRKEVNIKYFPFYNEGGGFNTAGFQEILENSATAGKLLILLNFPNNPTGYSISKSEAKVIVDIIQKIAKGGCNVIPILDDAYFGLFYEEETLKESLFGSLANLNERVLAIKVDGATKEEFVWGFRVGFITFAAANTSSDVYSALEKKTMGAIRGNISNCPQPSQNIVLKVLESPNFRQEQRTKNEILKKRAMQVKEVLKNPKYNDVWNLYPFNSGYFMCLELKTVNAEQLRQYLLQKYGIGIISINETDIRIAFSCLELNQIPDLFELIYKAIKELEK